METGKIYKVVHIRKGVFHIKITEISDEWVTGTIVQGFANAILKDNEREAGEDIKVKKSLCKLIPV